MHVPEGSCYLLRARDALHRTSPITKDTRRTVIVYTYATTEDLQDTSISHESMESIYPKDTKKEALA
ncbi:HalD/BesD family halogenase [Halomonas sp. BC2]|uniref:HalD/BesD family halogenase n=1 Tax=Halomonas sp. BC2 TaxID=1670449 RepID=UPI00406959F0